MSDYRIIKVMSEVELYILSHPRYKDDIWSLTSKPIRTPKKCEVLNIPVKGKRAFSPITNGYNRMHRISQAGMQELLKQFNRKSQPT
jgi:hypothetical protein